MPSADVRAAQAVGALALACALLACGATPPPPTPTGAPAADCPSDASPADAIRASDDNVLHELMDAVAATGSKCADYEEEPNVIVCDRDASTTPTLIITYREPHAFFLSHYVRKDDKSCEDMLPKLNELNVGIDVMKLICNQDRVTFFSSFVVPTHGLSPKDVQEHAAGFRKTIALVLRTSGLLDYVK